MENENGVVKRENKKIKFKNKIQKSISETHLAVKLKDTLIIAKLQFDLSQH